MRARTPVVFAIFVFTAAVGPVSAWEDHTTISHIALEAGGLASKQLRTSELSDFIVRNEAALAAFLAELEAHCAAAIAEYPPLPPALAFSSNAEPDPVRRFMMALRLNPEYSPRLYRKALPGESDDGRSEIPFADLAYVLYKYPYARFYAYESGENISALAVIASAADEPDYGFDIGLFEDNDTWYGALYGWGKQPFGNPTISYGSQAPFHMGFYNEGALVYKAAPAVRRSYPELRAVQFGRLARFAKGLGEEYWAHRFAGWALHYVQDLVMPYHASIMPGRGSAYLVWVGALDAIGIKGPYNKVLQDVTNKHYLLEMLQLRLLSGAYAEGERSGSLMGALRDGPPAAAFDEGLLRTAVAREAYKAGRKANRALERVIRDRKAYAAIQALYEVDGYDIFTVAYGPGDKRFGEFEASFASLLGSLGTWTRAWVDFVLR
jgi:hypothetical protein